MPCCVLDERWSILAPTIVNVNYRLTSTKGRQVKANLFLEQVVYHYDSDSNVIIRNSYNIIYLKSKNNYYFSVCFISEQFNI